MPNSNCAPLFQPQTIAQVSPLYLPYVQSARIFSNPATWGAEASKLICTPFTNAGTVVDGLLTPYGVGIKGNGTNGVYSRGIVSTSFRPGWLMACFVCNTASTVQKTLVSLGSSSTVGGAFFAISSGTGSASNILGQFRPLDSNPSINKLGAVPVAGKAYCVVFSVPSGLKSEAFTYVNGLKYTGDSVSSSDVSFAIVSQAVVEGICALKRSTAANYSSDTVLATARGWGVLPENLAQAMSENPWNSLFCKQKQALYTKLPIGKWRVDPSKNLYISGRKVVTGVKVSFQAGGNIHAAGFDTSPGVFKIGATGRITANSFIEDARF